MANRRSLIVRRTDVPAPLRPATGFDSALRSDFFYIPEDLDPPEAILQARDLSHTSIEVSFDPLSIPRDPNFGAATEIALVRSPSGYPTTLLDGNMVRRHPPEAPDNTGWVRIPDTGLSPGTWYYYGLFAKYESVGNTHWLRVGQRSILLPQEYLSGDHLWERIPEWYRRADMDPGGRPGVLRRMIDTVGYVTDAHRTWALTVGDVWDAEKISADLLPYLGDTLGQPVEYAAGDERYRALVSRILPLRKLKGTEFGTEAYLSSITGYRTRVYPGLNLMPTVDEAEAKYTSGLWQKGPVGTATLTRVVSTGSPAGSPANGHGYHRLTFSGTTSQQPALQLGTGTVNGVTDLTKLIPVTAGHQLVASAFIHSSFTGILNARYRWFGPDGVAHGTTTAALGQIGGTWIRRTTPTAPVSATTVPAGASFAEVNLELSAATTINGLVVEVTDIMVTDLSWRPEDVPGVANSPPLSTTHPGFYDDVGYYESPRSVHVNLYPQRINYAFNSNFTLDNIPPEAWTVAERSTWGLLKQAYSDWGDITDAQPGDSEDSWADLAEGFEPLADAWTIAFDTDYDPLGGRLVLTPSGAPNYTAQVQSHFVPVIPDDSLSAAFIAWASTPGVTVTLAVEFYTDDGPQYAMPADVNVHGRAWVMTDTWYRYELRNAVVPPGALFARVIIEMNGAPLVTTPVLDPDTGDPTGDTVTTGTGPYTGYLARALIENAQVPGSYFDGNEVDAAYGDYFWTGLPYESYSVYYQNYRSFINEPLGADRITSLMEELLPVETDFIIRTAAGGLY